MKTLLTIFFLIFSTIACGGNGNTLPADELSNDLYAQEEYYIKPGDVLMIKVWGEPRLSGEVVIREDGRFSMQLIEEINASGKSLLQLKDELETKLTEFVPGVSVSPSVIQAAPVRYFLVGQFAGPGEYRSELGISLLQAIAKAGGFAPFADESKLILIRKGAGQEIRYSLDYNRVVSGEEPNPKLKDGDLLSVK